MLSTGWTPRTVPYGADQTIYLVIDRFGRHGSVYRETEVEQTDLETIITDLMTGQFNDPVRVVAFNTLEHWSDDVSGEIAAEIQIRCDIDGVAVPEHIQDFVASHTGPTQPYSKKIARRGVWVEPSLLAEIEYRAKSAEGKLRHPFFKGIREDL